MAIALHRVPESEDYEAATIGGTPRGVLISSSGGLRSVEPVLITENILCIYNTPKKI